MREAWIFEDEELCDLFAPRLPEGVAAMMLPKTAAEVAAVLEFFDEVMFIVHEAAPRIMKTLATNKKTNGHLLIPGVFVPRSPRFFAVVDREIMAGHVFSRVFLRIDGLPDYQQVIKRSTAVWKGIIEEIRRRDLITVPLEEEAGGR